MGSRKRSAGFLAPLPADHAFRTILHETKERIDACRRTRYGALNAIHAAHRAFSQDIEAFHALLRESAIKPARRGTSPFLPLLHLLFGAGKSPRSKSRYARLLEFAQANDIRDLGAYIRRAGGLDAIFALIAATSAPQAQRRIAPAPMAERIDHRPAAAGITYASVALGVLHQIELAQAQAGGGDVLAGANGDDSFRFGPAPALTNDPGPNPRGSHDSIGDDSDMVTMLPADSGLLAMRSGDVDCAGQAAIGDPAPGIDPFG